MRKIAWFLLSILVLQFMVYSFRNYLINVKKPTVRPTYQHQKFRSSPGLDGPEIVVVITTARRKGEVADVLFSTLDSLATAIDTLEPSTSPKQNVSMPDLAAQISSDRSRDRILVLVFNTMSSTEEHEVFQSAYDRYRRHKAFRFLQLSPQANLSIQSSSGASVPIMKPLSDHDHDLPSMGVVTQVSRFFESPSSFLSGWDNWAQEVLTKEPQRKQSADYLSALHYANNVFPDSDLLVWEDDHVFCPNVFVMLTDFQRIIGQKHPDYGILKMGYGGSGHLMNHRHLQTMLPFLYGISFRSNMGEGIHKFLSFFRLPHYVTSTVYALHKRGNASTFGDDRHGDPRQHLDVNCSSALPIQWGHYADCIDSDIHDLGIRCTAGYLYRRI